MSFEDYEAGSNNELDDKVVAGGTQMPKKSKSKRKLFA